MKFSSDIDIDFADRNLILEHIDYVTASIRDETVKKHNTGIYVTDIPYDPLTDLAAIDYVEAENRGYIKFDLLNVFVYKQVTSEAHLLELMKEPDWSLLKNREFVEKIIHIGNHYDTILSMSGEIDSILKMAMFLSVIRPGKKHLIGIPWNELEKKIWVKDGDGYFFKKAHAISYAHLVAVHMNLLSG
jgi:hypothetical protein